MKRGILALSQELRLENNVMDKILYRNPSKSEVIRRCGGDEKTRMTTQNRQKSNAKKGTLYSLTYNVSLMERDIQATK